MLSNDKEDLTYPALRAELELVDGRRRLLQEGARQPGEVAELEALDREYAAIAEAIIGMQVQLRLDPNVDEYSVRIESKEYRAGTEAWAEYVATCPELGIAASELSPERALLLLRDAVEEFLEGCDERGQRPAKPTRWVDWPTWAKANARALLKE